ncbi:cation:proton antiporter [Microbacterium sp. 1P10UB]|uniref:cation:proton antiporter n=1 Tax=unclassified Microbacterium TaxID=2609290 RepID=UPI0039A34C2C
MADLSTLLVIPLVAVLAPLLSRGISRWLPVPIVVFELVLGIAMGPSMLNWAQPSPFASTLAELGLAMLFFVAGTEIQFAALTGRTGARAGLGWLVSLVAGVALGWLIAPGDSAIVLGVALSSTALGTLLPILRDAGELRTPFGFSVSAVGAVGEFGPLVAISVFLGSRDPGLATVILAVFAVIAALAVWWALKAPQGRLHAVVTSTLHTSGQFAMRVVLLILAVLVALSLFLGIDMLLGAFTAGIVWRLVMREAPEADREAVDSKVEAVAFGFLVPMFFVYTGVTFDLTALTSAPLLLVGVVIAMVALFVVRGLPSMLASPVGASGRERLPIALMGATGLPIIVAVTSIAVEKSLITSAFASVLVGAGMLSVLVFPLVAMSLRGERASVRAAIVEDVI